MTPTLDAVAAGLGFPEGRVAMNDGTTEHVAVPDLVTTNLCESGADMHDAWIAASSTGATYKARWPRAGLPLAFTG